MSIGATAIVAVVLMFIFVACLGDDSPEHPGSGYRGGKLPKGFDKNKPVKFETGARKSK